MPAITKKTKGAAPAVAPAKDEPVNTPAPAVDQSPDSIKKLYEDMEKESLSRAKGGVGAEVIRAFIKEVMTTTGQERLLLSAVVRSLAKMNNEKVQNGTVRSAASKEYDLVKDDAGHVWIVPQSKA